MTNKRIQELPDGALKVVAPAKVNLFLHITGRRDDGYHELESLFVFTETGDELVFRQSEALEFQITGPFASELQSVDGDSGNLVCQAAGLLAEAVGQRPKGNITLTKNLPVAAGIGGGSADAAASLIGLMALWDLNLPEGQFAEIALKLGADVPACLHQTPLYVTGIGETLTTTKLPQNYGILLVNPLKAVSTPAIFTSFKTSAQPFDDVLPDVLQWPTDHGEFLKFLRQNTYNTLQKPAKLLCRDITSILEVLDAQENLLYSAMSGSGATCFALFQTKQQAELAASKVKEAHPDWWVMFDTLVAG